MADKNGVIYILTNPSFPDYVKIGYADDIDSRLKKLNQSECIPFAFRVYATYEVDARLSDLKIHSIIDKLNPNLRSIDNFNGQKRVREFYAMSAEDAYSILEAIAEINGRSDKLVKVAKTTSEEDDENTAEDVASVRKERLAPFTFSMCKIPIGAELEFWSRGNKNTGIKCTVVDDKHVSYGGAEYSLSALATSLSNAKWPVAGPRYFKYKGEWLNDIRTREENKQDN